MKRLLRTINYGCLCQSRAGLTCAAHVYGKYSYDLDSIGITIYDRFQGREQMLSVFLSPRELEVFIKELQTLLRDVQELEQMREGER